MFQQIKHTQNKFQSTIERRGSILKNSKQQTLGHTNAYSLTKNKTSKVKFNIKLGSDNEKQKVNEFSMITPETKANKQSTDIAKDFYENIEMGQKNKKLFEKGEEDRNEFEDGECEKRQFVNEINYINTLYNHVLLIASSNFQINKVKGNHHKIEETKDKQFMRVQSFILKNIAIKEIINQRYREMKDVQKIASYLHLPPLLLHAQAKELFAQPFLRKKKQLQVLTQKINILNQINSNQFSDSLKPGQINFDILQKIKEKQEECKQQSRLLEKQNKMIQKLQTEEKRLLKKFYGAEKDFHKNQQSSTDLKIKVKQIQDFSQHKALKIERSKSAMFQKKNALNSAELDMERGLRQHENVLINRKIEQTQRILSSLPIKGLQKPRGNKIL